jgi:hypothetical protein
MEAYYPYMFLVGLGLAVLGFLGLVVLAFRQRIAWGVGVVVCPPLSVVFGLRYLSRCLVPLVFLILGIATASFPALATRLAPIDLGPRDKLVDQERHLTLTGWDRHDYAFLREKSDAVVLQMANPDVTDETLKLLRGMTKLRELDLTDSAVTDNGLEALGGLAHLETLRLRRTRITNAGFTSVLDQLPALRQIDLRDTAVDSDLVQAWREAKEGRRAMR